MTRKNFNPPTIILRHRKENKKKCSLRGLESKEGFIFYNYPLATLPSLEQHVVLSLEGPPLTFADQNKGIFLIDATWRYAAPMERFAGNNLQKRSLPAHFKTAYPRKQEDCPDPTRGLASIEALYIAFRILKRPDATALLDNYYWKDTFLHLNGFTVEGDEDFHHNKKC